MVSQKVAFVVMARGVSMDSDTLPISVFVSPRLYDADRLEAFPDWLNWTPGLKDRGLSLTIMCSGQQMNVPVNRVPLRPELWRAMFHSETFVRSHTFDDYSDRAILSYPQRFALSTLKSIYQQGAVALALPDRAVDDREKGSLRRSFLRDLLAGLEVNWSDERGDALRDYYRHAFASPTGTFFPAKYSTAAVGSDGLLSKMPPGPANTFLRERMTEQFAVVNNVPLGTPLDDNPSDFDHLIDFHQALSSLNSFPALLRALGLVFDFDLPVDFVAPSAGTGRLSVTDVPGHDWRLADTAVPPDIPPIETAYVRFAGASGGSGLFGPAPAVVAGASNLEAFGLLNMDPGRYGLAQVDVDGGLHKSIILAETWSSSTSPAEPPHPEVFDPSTTLPSLRSAGISLFADGRALKLLSSFEDQKDFNTILESKKTNNAFPVCTLYAENLIHGYRLDVWDSLTGQWHSLHERESSFVIEAEGFGPVVEEGFTQLAATQAAPDVNTPAPDDLYLHESIARWAGWSLSVPMPGRQLSSHPDPDRALDNPNPNEPATPFKMTTRHDVVPGSLPSLRFGRRYRIRVRVVDICGNSIRSDESITDALTKAYALPVDPEGFVYLRYEPVAAPVVVIRDEQSVQLPGSEVHRLVIRTRNLDISQDANAAETIAAERHLVPPQTSVELGERLGMFDDPAGKLVQSQSMYDLIAAGDAGGLAQVELTVRGQPQVVPLEAGESIDPLPYLPDVLSRGTAFRDLPGTATGTVGRIGAGGTLGYEALDDPNPRPGSATLVPFGDGADWQKLRSFRLHLGEGTGAPTWDDVARTLTVFLPKASVHTIATSSYMTEDDLKRMGVWQWLREYVDYISVTEPVPNFLQVGLAVDQIAHILQRTVEGGHWMLTPPTLLTLMHAVQQPIGVPQFTAISVQHERYGGSPAYPNNEAIDPSATVLQTEPEKAPTGDTELAPITAWRQPGSVEAYLLGGLAIHAASTSKIEIRGEWDDPVDIPGRHRKSSETNLEGRSAHVDVIPVVSNEEGYVGSSGRPVAYYDSDHHLLCFVRGGDLLGNLPSGTRIVATAAPRHHLDDTKHHRISYTAVATSRYTEYFDPDEPGGFTRTSAPVVVDVPASARPAAPAVLYVVPTFGWQRQVDTNMKRSTRFGGGLRVYLDRPWFSSGEGELLAVTLYDEYSNGLLKDRDKWKSAVTQWGRDPIWETDAMDPYPRIQDFPDAVASERFLSLERPAPGRVDVAGFAVHFDEERQLWYGDLTMNTGTLTYGPIVRLALVRYQPRALPDSKLSRVVLADYAQLTPERSAVVTADPYHSRRLRVTVSGIAPTGPLPARPGLPTRLQSPTQVTIVVQEHDGAVLNELGWRRAPDSVATLKNQSSPTDPELIRWTGTVEFQSAPAPRRYRLLIQEHEYLSANHAEATPTPGGGVRVSQQPRRLIYAETVLVDEALLGAPRDPTGTDVNGQ